MSTAGIVIIGDEILTGKFADENAAFLIGELRALGVELRRITVIPDVIDEIAATVAEFAGRFDHVVIGADDLGELARGRGGHGGHSTATSDGPSGCADVHLRNI